MTMHVPEGPKPSEQWLGKGNGSNRCGSVVEGGPLMLEQGTQRQR